MRPAALRSAVAFGVSGWNRGALTVMRNTFLSPNLQKPGTRNRPSDPLRWQKPLKSLTQVSKSKTFKVPNPSINIRKRRKPTKTLTNPNKAEGVLFLT